MPRRLVGGIYVVEAKKDGVTEHWAAATLWENAAGAAAALAHLNAHDGGPCGEPNDRPGVGIRKKPQVTEVAPKRWLG